MLETHIDPYIDPPGMITKTIKSKSSQSAIYKTVPQIRNIPVEIKPLLGGKNLDTGNIGP